MCQTEDYKMACGHRHDPVMMRNTTWYCGRDSRNPEPNPSLRDHTDKCESCTRKDTASAERRAEVELRKQIAEAEKRVAREKKATAGKEGGCCVIL